MKRVAVLFLALLLIVTGCGKEDQALDISVNDVCCPYEIHHEEKAVLITLHDGEQKGIHWQVEAIPEDVCQITQENMDDEYAFGYRIVGQQEGAAQLTVTALQADQTAAFVLTVVVNVGSDGKPVVSSHQHREREDITVEAEGLNYRWNVDVNGTLNFSFINDEDSWSARSSEDDVCVFSDMMSTPSGCKFSAQANLPGETTVVLVGEATNRTVHVVLQADDNGGLKVISVQEQ